MTKRGNKAADLLGGMAAVTEQMVAKDLEVSVRRADEQGELELLPLSRIKPREVDTRPLDGSHVSGLLESIEILGLIEPLVVDKSKVLLAGGHRLAALKQLEQENLASFKEKFSTGMIPVRVMPFVAENEPERALQIEIAENEHRRDYTPAQVRTIADHLRSAGYREGRGRPKPGEKSLMPALSVVIGKSQRTIQRYLYDDPNKKQTDVRFFLKKARKSLESGQKAINDNETYSELHHRLPKILAFLNAEINRLEGSD